MEPISKKFINIDLKKYIGRNYEEYDCLDLVKEFYKDHFGLEIENFYEGAKPTPEEIGVLVKTNKGEFVKVDGKPQFGDIVVIKLYGIACHLGVIVEGTKFLHSAKNIGSNIDRIERYSRLIEGYYRHRELSA